MKVLNYHFTNRTVAVETLNLLTLAQRAKEYFSNKNYQKAYQCRNEEIEAAKKASSEALKAYRGMVWIQGIDWIKELSKI